MSKIKFQVDPHLALLLSEGYRSTEQALKELVDNAWDADSECVNITLPEPMSGFPIIVEDDGSGMTEEEIKKEYLYIANNRRKRRGDTTQLKKRKVKGRKGIGKFAGLMAASTMRLETWSRGNQSSFVLNSNNLKNFDDIEGIPITLSTINDSSKEHGTKIILTDLNQTLRFPDPNKLRQLLIYEYGREEDFSITINGKSLDIDDIQGDYTDLEDDVVGLGGVNLRFTISDNKKKLRKPGIVIKVQGKVVGKPSFFGLDEEEDFPKNLLNTVFGEVEASGLIDHVTSDWGAIIENSELFEALAEYIKPILREKFKNNYGRDISLAQARFKKKFHKELSALPELKREYAEKAINRIIRRYYQEPDNKIEPIVSVILDALEKTDYRLVIEHINNSKGSEISTIAEALSEFGLVEIALMLEQTNSRLAFLDSLEAMCDNSNTLEAPVHKAIENSLWILGNEYSLFSSNKTLKKQIETYLSKEYKGLHQAERPDLLLNENILNEYCLIEFKRPCHPLNYADYQQATKYRNDFKLHTDKDIQVVLIGGKRGKDLPPMDRREPMVKIVVFNELISSARKNLDWLISELQSK